MDALWSHQAGSMVALCYDVWVAKDDGRNFGLLTIGLCCDTQPPTSSWCLVRRCGSKFRPNPWTRLEVVYHNQKWSLEAQNCAHHVHVGHHVWIRHHRTSLVRLKCTHEDLRPSGPSGPRTLNGSIIAKNDHWKPKSARMCVCLGRKTISSHHQAPLVRSKCTHQSAKKKRVLDRDFQISKFDLQNILVRWVHFDHFKEVQLWLI